MSNSYMNNNNNIDTTANTDRHSVKNKLYIDIVLRRKDFQLAVKQAIPLRGITGIFGHSGSGKSTLLRIISGLENAVDGSLFINDTAIIDSENGKYLKAEKRNIGLVFQDARLFPHLTVEQNLLFALKRRQKSSAENSHTNPLTFQQVVSATQLTRLLPKKEHEISGGERQRVALARALLAAPKFLLLDEPFSALDHSTKRELLRLLISIQQQFNMPMFYVSHAIDELQQISDNLLVLKQGKVVSFGNTHQIIHQLVQENHQIAPITSLSLPLIKHLPEFGLSELALSKQQSIYLPLLPEEEPENIASINNSDNNTDEKKRRNIRCLIYAEDISIAIEKPENSSIINKISGVIDDIDINELQVVLTVKSNVLESDSQTFFVSITLWSFQQLALKKGQDVYIQFKAGAVRTINTHHNSTNNLTATSNSQSIAIK